jgi:hypothetical protein
MDNALEIFGLDPSAQDKLALLAILVGVAPIVLSATDVVNKLGVPLETSRAMGKYMIPGAALATAGAFMYSGGVGKVVGYGAGAFVAAMFISWVTQS